MARMDILAVVLGKDIEKVHLEACIQVTIPMVPINVQLEVSEVEEEAEEEEVMTEATWVTDLETVMIAMKEKVLTQSEEDLPEVATDLLLRWQSNLFNE